MAMEWWFWFAVGAASGWASWAWVVRWLYGRIRPRVEAVVEPEGVGPVGPVPQDREPPQRRCQDCMGHGKRLGVSGNEYQCTWCQGRGRLPDFSSKRVGY